MLFDTHAHYDDPRFDEDREEVLREAEQAGVSWILNAGADMESSRKALEIASAHERIYAAVGVHPHETENMQESDLDILRKMAENPKVVAIGEIGLDYHYDNSPRDVQKYWLVRQINLAKELSLPIIIHNRESHQDMMEIIRKEGAGKNGGVFHCYSGSIEMAKELLKLGFYFSFGGAVTFKNASKLTEVVRFIPLDRILLETDCPYMTPEPHRGKRNHSGYLPLVARKIAEIKDKPVEEIENITTENAFSLFSIGR